MTSQNLEAELNAKHYDQYNARTKNGYAVRIGEIHAVGSGGLFFRSSQIRVAQVEAIMTYLF